ncbi:lipoprotein [Streptomyces kebangsaanensis]|uniref:lipoprotein n=1 Tax=Streptomyces kebangsaanensis TaxID=864058 RepID=UPI001F37FC2D|nr:lipoprotein [Streptomyces kebangsaanensis]
MAAGWEAGAVDRRAGGSPAAEEAADALLRQGPVTAGCEIGARAAGNIGFPHVRTGVPDAGDARTVLRAFVAAEGAVSEEKYRPFRAGGFEGAEVEYVRTSGIPDESKQERALTVDTPAGQGVLHLGGPDTGEHQRMLPRPRTRREDPAHRLSGTRPAAEDRSHRVGAGAAGTRPGHGGRPARPGRPTVRCGEGSGHDAQRRRRGSRPASGIPRSSSGGGRGRAAGAPRVRAAGPAPAP